MDLLTQSMERDGDRPSTSRETAGPVDIFSRFQGIVDNLETLAETVGVPESHLSDRWTIHGISNAYHHSLYRIFEVADKIAAGSVGHETIQEFRGVEMPLSCSEEWDFQLGDMVKVKYPLKDFESIQKRTIGWMPNLVSVHGHVGVITKVASKFDNAINVLFRDIFQGCTLYAGVLEKVSTDNIARRSSRWKVGDIVKPKSDHFIVPLLQIGLGSIPKRCIGKKGRVTAIAPFHVEVTFDNIRSIHISSALLEFSADQVPIARPNTASITKFQVGERVKVIDNMKNLIANEKYKEGWDKNMSRIKGQEVTIVNIQEDSTFNVQAKHDRPWRVSSKSVLRLDAQQPAFVDDLKFSSNDLAKIKTPQNIGKALGSKNIPPIFIKYLRIVGEIACVDDDHNCYVKFNKSQKIMVDPRALEKPTADEVVNYQNIQAQVENIKQGDDVFLDVGPPIYVQAVLQDSDFDGQVKMALTNPAKLVGFIDYDTAVIEYQSGVRYRIEMEYLTVPDKFKAKDFKTILDSNTAEKIRDMIAEAVRAFYIEDDIGAMNWNVDVTSSVYCCPPSIEVRIQSLTAKLENVVNWVQKYSGWKIVEFCPGQFLLTGVDGFDSEIKLSIIFNDNESDVEKQVLTVGTETIEEGPANIENTAEGFGGESYPISAQPIISNMADFKYYRCYDPNLGQNVYVPYILARERPIPHSQQEQHENDARRNITNIAHVDQA